MQFVERARVRLLQRIPSLVSLVLEGAAILVPLHLHGARLDRVLEGRAELSSAAAEGVGEALRSLVVVIGDSDVMIFCVSEYLRATAGAASMATAQGSRVTRLLQHAHDALIVRAQHHSVVSRILLRRVYLRAIHDIAVVHAVVRYLLRGLVRTVLPLSRVVDRSEALDLQMTGCRRLLTHYLGAGLTKVGASPAYLSLLYLYESVVGVASQRHVGGILHGSTLCGVPSDVYWLGAWEVQLILEVKQHIFFVDLPRLQLLQLKCQR